MIAGIFKVGRTWYVNFIVDEDIISSKPMLTLEEAIKVAMERNCKKVIIYNEEA